MLTLKLQPFEKYCCTTVKGNRLDNCSVLTAREDKTSRIQPFTLGSVKKPMKTSVLKWKCPPASCSLCWFSCLKQFVWKPQAFMSGFAKRTKQLIFKEWNFKTRKKKVCLTIKYDLKPTNMCKGTSRDILSLNAGFSTG